MSTQPDQLVVRAATGEDARFILALHGAPGTATFLAVSDRSEADLRTELDAPTEHTGGLIAEHQNRPVAALRWTPAEHLPSAAVGVRTVGKTPRCAQAQSDAFRRLGGSCRSPSLYSTE